MGECFDLIPHESRGKLSLLYLSLQRCRAVKEKIQMLPPLTSTQGLIYRLLSLSFFSGISQGAVNIESQPLPATWDHTLYTSSWKFHQLAAGQLLPGQTEEAVKAGGTDHPSQYKSHLPGHSTPTKLGRTPALWVSSYLIARPTDSGLLASSSRSVRFPRRRADVPSTSSSFLETYTSMN